MTLSYILQIVTIAITLGLGLISAYQNRKLQHGQNIIAVTTNYRSKRSEQLRECGEKLITNTMPELLMMQETPVDMIKDACQASETIGMILHRNFHADKELIEMGEQIVNLAIQYVESVKEDVPKEEDELWRALMHKRECFKLKCDLYISAEWDRIKRETKGKDTSSESWIEFHEKISEKFSDLFAEIDEKYGPGEGK